MRRGSGAPVIQALLAAGVVLAAGGSLTGCFAGYEGDTLLRDGTGELHTRGRRLGCLDVRVALIEDRAVEAGWPVVGFDMGNRCDAPVYVDLRRASVTGRLADGRVVRMRPFDPRSEIDAAVLDGRSSAREVIAYIPPAGARDGTPARSREVCVDVGGITAADPAPPVCFETREGT